MWRVRQLGARTRIAVLAFLSVVVGVVVALLTNLVTDDPRPALIGGLVVATVVTALLAAAQARAGVRRTAPPEADHVQLVDGGRIDRSRLDVDPATAARTRQEARGGGEITDSSITVRRAPDAPRRHAPGPVLPTGNPAGSGPAIPVRSPGPVGSDVPVPLGPHGGPATGTARPSGDDARPAPGRSEP